MRVLVVADARPDFMKVAPILRALEEREHQAVLVHTGERSDVRTSGCVLPELDLPEPDHHLGIDTASTTVQTVRAMEAFGPVLREEQADWVVMGGDVDLSVDCALVAAKLREETGTRVAHLEAGLRSGDPRGGQAVNRVLTDRLSDLLLTPSRDVHPNLAAEGIQEARVRFVGNVMIDTLLSQLPLARTMEVPARYGLERGGYALATLHRRSTVEDAGTLAVVLTALAAVRNEMPVFLSLQPRTQEEAVRCGLGRLLEQLTVLEPVDYLEMVSLVDGAAVVLTDSGGRLQEMTTAFGVPCVTLCEQTERLAMIAEGTNRSAPRPLTAVGVLGAFRRALDMGRSEAGECCPEGWDGRAGERVVEALASFRWLRAVA